jgi:hypothetical protein
MTHGSFNKEGNSLGFMPTITNAQGTMCGSPLMKKAICDRAGYTCAAVKCPKQSTAYNNLEFAVAHSLIPACLSEYPYYTSNKLRPNSRFMLISRCGFAHWNFETNAAIASQPLMSVDLPFEITVATLTKSAFITSYSPCASDIFLKNRE